MADKENKENKTKKVKLSYSIENSLLGLMLAIVSLIALVNYGYVGGGISYAFAYILGYWYPLFLVVFVCIGIYIFIKRKKPKSLTPLTVISFILLVVFLATASSKYEGADLHNYYDTFIQAFDKCHDGLQVNFLDLSAAKGGFIGFSLYAFLVNLMGEFMTSVVIVVFVLTFGYLAFRHPIMYLYVHIIAYFETSEERKVVKENKKKAKESKKAIKLAKKESKQNKKLQQLESKEMVNNNSINNDNTHPRAICDHPFTFDIFTESLFDDDTNIKVAQKPESINNVEESSIPEDDLCINTINKETLDTSKESLDDVQQAIIQEEILKAKQEEEVQDELQQEEIIENEDQNINNNSQEDIFASEQDNENLDKAIENKIENDGFYDTCFEYENNNNIDDETIETKEEIQMDMDKQIDETLDESLFSDKNEETVNEYIPPFVSANKETVNDSIKVQSNPINEHKVVCDDLYSLLKDNDMSNSTEELKEEVEENCIKINQKLEELNIKAKVSNYIIGPCVTRYEIVPDLGVRVSSIVNIQNDLKLALAAINLRMEAPIPGKSAVGIEVANKKRYPVYLKEVLEPFKDNKDKLLVAIGKNLNNEPVTLSIDKMPHLLIAGATGSGKSVCINGIIMSLILRTTPDEVKMILVDPKKVEMLPYANMPHLLCPVVTDPKKANNALKKVVVEMDHRYDLFASHGVRNIDSYNTLDNVDKLSRIVVIIDELADLMLACSKEVEESIQRITQLARAAGIYLIVATQRPSVDVITGVIKANIPSRIAFSVSSMVDSRTILDKSGAEDLLGKGDMLMDISGTNSLNRVQGVFVSDKEIINVVNAIKAKYDTDFDEEFLNLEDDKKEEINSINESGEDFKDDPMYEDIKAFVIKNQRASTSILLRHFSIGYIRASKIIDRLEEEGIIGPLDGSKPREVLVKEEDLNDDESNN